MKTKKIVIFGSYVTDLTAKCPRFPKEGETIMGSFFKSGPGGKGSNQAVAAHRAGADVTLITKLGEDSLGNLAESFFIDEKMHIDGLLKDNNCGTGAALIMVNSQSMQNEIVVIPGACGHITNEDINAITPILDTCDIILTQLETNYDATLRVLQYCKKRGCITILNPAPAIPLEEEILTCVDIITPNETEAAILTDCAASNSVEDIRNMGELLRKKGIKNVIITRGKEGSYLVNDDGEYICPSVNLKGVVDTTGAGDAFNGALAAGLSYGFDIKESIKYATIVSSLAVSKFGTAPAMPFKEEINDFYPICF